MPRRSDFRITGRSVAALRGGERDAVFWDRELAGFGVRVHATGRKVYVVQSRGPAGLTRLSLGPHGDLFPQEARRRAREIIDRIKRGLDPVPAPPAPELTVAGLAERYLRLHVAAHCRASSARLYRLELERNVLPALGAKPAAAVSREEVAALHHRLRATPYSANRAIKILARMFRQAETWELLPPGGNPCRGVRLYRERSRDRFLTAEEYRRLGRALGAAAAGGALWPAAVAAIRLLLLTGCRKGEILTLRWDDVDLTARELRLRDAKAGPRMVPLTPPARRVLAAIPRADGNPWVIRGRKPGSHMTDLSYHWAQVAARAGLDGVRIHDIRHSFASRALALGESLTMIGRLLGHARAGTTARYAHLQRDAEKAAARRVGDSIAAQILPPGAA
ncbi:MAG: site-specific integrase [Defluviicoccus sp.]|nr:site-specific integrase [Defluviicoccus sp.]MDE0383195.1 site-specific integrase [Defluviicoccus sp.]